MSYLNRCQREMVDNKHASRPRDRQFATHRSAPANRKQTSDMAIFGTVHNPRKRARTLVSSTAVPPAIPAPPPAPRASRIFSGPSFNSSISAATEVSPSPCPVPAHQRRHPVKPISRVPVTSAPPPPVPERLRRSRPANTPRREEFSARSIREGPSADIVVPKRQGPRTQAAPAPTSNKSSSQSYDVNAARKRRQEFRQYTQAVRARLAKRAERQAAAPCVPIVHDVANVDDGIEDFDPFLDLVLNPDNNRASAAAPVQSAKLAQPVQVTKPTPSLKPALKKAKSVDKKKSVRFNDDIDTKTFLRKLPPRSISRPKRQN